VPCRSGSVGGHKDDVDQISISYWPSSSRRSRGVPVSQSARRVVSSATIVFSGCKQVNALTERGLRADLGTLVLINGMSRFS
jgi:hypothetical protein